MSVGGVCAEHLLGGGPRPCLRTVSVGSICAEHPSGWGPRAVSEDSVCGQCLCPLGGGGSRTVSMPSTCWEGDPSWPPQTPQLHF